MNEWKRERKKDSQKQRKNERLPIKQVHTKQSASETDGAKHTGTHTQINKK